jgi:N-acylglucosamine 2-epimerase
MNSAPTPLTHLGGRPLSALRNFHRHYLFEEYIPFWDRHGIDHELGGFTCTLDHDGTLLDDSKNMWYQGRGLWTYATLYRHFGHEGTLTTARGTYDFLLRHGRDAQGDWVTSLDRHGRITQPASKRGFDGLFVAEGLQAYARATDNQEALDLAIASLWRAVEIWEDPNRDMDDGYIPHSYTGMRTLGNHMVLILTLTQILEFYSDPKLTALADQVIEAITQHFWNPEYRLLNEALDYNYQRPNDANEDFIYLGHAIEILWMLLPEAMRRRDHGLFEQTAERFRRHIEVAWDDVYGGVFRAMHVHGAYTFDKVLWAQEEVLIGCLILIEHTNWKWPRHWFDKMFAYVEERCSLKQYGYPLYTTGGDRKVTFQPHVQRKEHYHHPRRIMRNLLALEGLVERQGQPSGFWDKT